MDLLLSFLDIFFPNKKGVIDKSLPALLGTVFQEFFSFLSFPFLCFHFLPFYFPFLLPKIESNRIEVVFVKNIIVIINLC